MKCHVLPIKFEMLAEMCKAQTFWVLSTESSGCRISFGCLFSEIKLGSHTSFKAISGLSLRGSLSYVLYAVAVLVL